MNANHRERSNANLIKPDDARTAPLSASTITQYLSILHRMARDPEAALTTDCSVSTYRNRRAALDWAMQLIDKRVVDEADRSNRRKCLDVLRPFSTLQRLQHFCSRLAALDVGEMDAGEPRVIQLAVAPSNWWPVVRLHISEHRDVTERAAMVALCLTGCRPGEVPGMLMRKSGDVFDVHIFGNKVNSGQGQPERVLSYRLTDGSMVRELVALLNVGTDDLSPFRGLSASRMSDLFQQISVKNFRAKGVVNASMLRNQVAANLKALGWPKPAIAQTLGHRATATQKAYGRRFLALKTGWCAPAAVRATHAVASNSTIDVYHAQREAAQPIEQPGLVPA